MCGTIPEIDAVLTDLGAQHRPRENEDKALTSKATREWERVA